MSFAYYQGTLNSLFGSSSNIIRRVILSCMPEASFSWRAVQVSLVNVILTNTIRGSNAGMLDMAVDGSRALEMKIFPSDTNVGIGLIVIPMGNGLTFSGSQEVQWALTADTAFTARAQVLMVGGK